MPFGVAFNVREVAKTTYVVKERAEERRYIVPKSVSECIGRHTNPLMDAVSCEIGAYSRTN